MNLQEINQELVTLKTRAAKINAEINSSPTKEIKKARVAEYMNISSTIAELKQKKHACMFIAELKQEATKLRAEQAVANAGKKKDAVKLAVLLFPAENKVQYFATTAGIVDLMVLLREVFEEGIPAVTSYYSVPPDQEASIPEEWYELVKNE